MEFLFLALGVASAVVFICLRTANVELKHAVLKGVTSVFFILTGLFAFTENPECPKFLGAFTVAGAIFGMLGDVSLDLKYVYDKDFGSYLKIGFINFLIGHIFYSIAMLCTYFGEYSFINVLVSVVFGALMFFGVSTTEKLLDLEYGKFKRISSIYMAVIGFTFALSVSLMISEKFTLHTILLVVGMTLFLVSDALLSGLYFGKDEKRRTNRLTIILNHAVYYAAQFTIALSLSFYRG